MSHYIVIWKVYFDKITERLRKCCEMPPKLPDVVDPVLVTQKVVHGVFNGVKTTEIDNLAAETAAYMSTTHPGKGFFLGALSHTINEPFRFILFVSTTTRECCLVNYIFDPFEFSHSYEKWGGGRFSLSLFVSVSSTSQGMAILLLALQSPIFKKKRVLHFLKRLIKCSSTFCACVYKKSCESEILKLNSAPFVVVCCALHCRLVITTLYVTLHYATLDM